MTYIVNNEVVYHTEADLIAAYSSQGNWELSHSDLIRKGLSKLIPGQRLVLTSSQFVASGEDDEGEWTDRMKHPKVIQLANEEVFAMFATRNKLNDMVTELTAKIAELTVERDAFQNQLAKTEGKMHKYGNSVGKEVRV